MLHRLIPYKYKKWSTLLGGVLINLALGSSYTFGNMSPYFTSYLREYDGLDVRYSQSVWILSILGISSSTASILSGMLNSYCKINVKLTIFIGCLLMRFLILILQKNYFYLIKNEQFTSSGVALTFFTVKSSFMLTLLSYGIISGII